MRRSELRQLQYHFQRHGMSHQLLPWQLAHLSQQCLPCQKTAQMGIRVRHIKKATVLP